MFSREVLEALDLHGLLFERGIELRVIERDGHVAGDGEEQLDVLAGKEIAVHRFAQAQHGDGVFANPAGNEIVQVELFERLANRRAWLRAPRAAIHKRDSRARTARLGDRENSGPAVPA